MPKRKKPKSKRKKTYLSDDVFLNREVPFRALIYLGILSIALITFLTEWNMANMNATINSFEFSLPITKARAATVSSGENVIIAIIDGVRYQEIFGDAEHKYAPHLWNDLKPQGTLFTNVWNMGITATTAGHQTIITGAWQNLLNNGNLLPDQRTKQPNIFEYYRKQKNIPQAKVWTVTGKIGNLKSLDYSLNPDYGYNFKASALPVGDNDEVVFEKVKQTMDENHPSLLFINFGEVDHQGHLGPYENYTNAIKTVDQIVYELWQKIQSDEYYKDKTTLIITADHGRHSDSYATGFKSHGASTNGDRHEIFLAIGPRIRRDYTVDSFKQQIDIVPTVGALLGFKTPYADGEAMDEMFTDQEITLASSANEISKAIKPKIAAGKDKLHLIYHQKDKTSGGFDVYYEKSTDDGLSWSKPVLIFDSTPGGRLFYEADIALAGQGTDQEKLMVFGAAVAPIDLGGQSFEWRAYSRQSADQGYSWREISEAGTLGIITSSLSLAANDNEFAAVALGTKKAGAQQQLFYFKETKEGGWQVSAVNDSMINILNPSLALESDFSRVVWQGLGQKKLINYKYWNIIDDFSGGNSSWTKDRRIAIQRESYIFHYDPEIDCFNKICQLTWSKLVAMPQESAYWRVKQRESSTMGTKWENDKVISSPNINSWNPALTLLNESESVIVWEQHNGSSADIYGRKKNGSRWSKITNLTQEDGLDSVLPDVASYANNTYLAWQELAGSNWEVKAKKISF